MMIQIATWASVLILGPMAIVIFAWFLRDMRRIWRESTLKRLNVQIGRKRD